MIERVAAVAQRSRRQIQPRLQGEEHVAAAGMHDPTSDLPALDAGALERARENGVDVLRGEPGNGTGEYVAQQTAAVLEAQCFAGRGIAERDGLAPRHRPTSGRWPA